jgi:hypothetical protein
MVPASSFLVSGSVELQQAYDENDDGSKLNWIVDDLWKTC